MQPTHSHKQDPSVVSSRLTTAAVDAVFTVTLLVVSASLVAMAIGDPELIALVAGTGIVVLLAGYAILGLYSRCREHSLTGPTTDP